MIPLIAETTALSLQFINNNPLESVTLYSFFTATIAMGARGGLLRPDALPR